MVILTNSENVFWKFEKAFKNVDFFDTQSPSVILYNNRSIFPLPCTAARHKYFKFEKWPTYHLNVTIHFHKNVFNYKPQHTRVLLSIWIKKKYKLNSKFSLQNLLTSAILRTQVWHATVVFSKAIAWTSWPFVNEFSKKKN